VFPGGDADGDTIPNATDNCPLIENPAQEDNDALGGAFGGGDAWIIQGTLPEGATGGGDACDVNDDNDLACTDAEELGSDLRLGGGRNPLNPWDFADVPTPALPGSGVRNGAITLADVGATLAWVGRSLTNGTSDEGRNYTDDANNNGVEDGAEYDRTPAGAISGQPNGAITLQDVGVVLAQVGASCIAAPN
jgi:hypothetical protein